MDAILTALVVACFASVVVGCIVFLVLDKESERERQERLRERERLNALIESGAHASAIQTRIEIHRQYYR